MTRRSTSEGKKRRRAATRFDWSRSTSHSIMTCNEHGVHAPAAASLYCSGGTGKEPTAEVLVRRPQTFFKFSTLVDNLLQQELVRTAAKVMNAVATRKTGISMRSTKLASRTSDTEQALGICCYCAVSTAALLLCAAVSSRLRLQRTAVVSCKSASILAFLRTHSIPSQALFLLQQLDNCHARVRVGGKPRVSSRTHRASQACCPFRLVTSLSPPRNRPHVSGKCIPHIPPESNRNQTTTT